MSRTHEKIFWKKFKVILYIFELWFFKKLSDTGKKNHVFYKKNVNRNCFFLWIKGTWDLIWLDLCILQMRIELIFVKLTTRQPICTVIQPIAAWHIFFHTSYKFGRFLLGLDLVDLNRMADNAVAFRMPITIGRTPIRIGWRIVQCLRCKKIHLIE